jgi:hypothetical protein
VASERKLFPESITSKQEYLILDTFTKGYLFGFTALEKEGKCRVTFEVRSKKAQVLKIHRQQFFDFFGGELGEPVAQMKGIIKSMQVWFIMKL